MSFSLARLGFAAAFFASGQGAAQTPFDLLPLWPADGNAARPQLRGKYVFRDLTTMEIVISYPSDDAAPDGPRTIYRFRPQSQVDASLGLTIKREVDLLRYEYIVHNGLRARQSVEIWTLIAPSSADHLELQQRDWAKIRLRGTETRQAVFPTLPPGDTIMWSSHSDTRLRITPGSSASGFIIRSDYLPGFTSAYMQGGPALSTNGDLPVAVARQMAPFLQHDGANQSVITLGPRFDPSSTKTSIAGDYLAGIQAAAKSGAINPASPFYASLTTFLKRVIASNRDLIPERADELTRVAHSDLEKEILSGVVLALH